MTNTAITDTFLHASTPLEPVSAVAAIILDEKKRVLLQLRDDKETIFFPNHWGCFGGAIEPGETLNDTLHRELQEELGIAFDPASVERSITLTFNVKQGDPDINRYFFIVHSTAEYLSKVTIGEGQESKLFTAEQALQLPNMTPYDQWAIWIYFNQQRMT